MKILEIKIRRFKDLIKGILLGQGTQWTLTRHNVVDYVLDGFQYTNRHYVVYENEVHKDTILHRILTLKRSLEKELSIDDYSILDSYDSLYSFFETNQILVAICLHREDVIYVGKIKEVSSKSFAVELYDTELEKMGIENIPFDKVRYVQIHTDYLDSLSLLLNEHV